MESSSTDFRELAASIREGQGADVLAAIRKVESEARSTASNTSTMSTDDLTVLLNCLGSDDDEARHLRPGWRPIIHAVAGGTRRLRSDGRRDDEAGCSLAAL